MRLELRDVAPVVENLAARRLILAEDQAEERALARAVRPDQAVKLARLEHKVDVGGDLEAAEALVELARLEERHHAVSRARRPKQPLRQQRERHDEPFRREQHGDHEQHAHHDERVLASVDGERLKAADQEDRAEQRRRQVAAPADRDPDDRQRRRRDAHARRRDVLAPGRVENAAQSRERTADDKSRELILAHVIAEHRGALGVFADRDQNVAER